jgi:iron(III) transport system permease protein
MSPSLTLATPRPRPSRDAQVMRATVLIALLVLALTVAAPLGSLLSKAFQDKAGAFAGLANFFAYFASPALTASIGNSLFVALLATAATTLLAFLFAYGLTRTCMPGKGLFRTIALVPILAPSLLPAIALVYLFGNQGFLKSWLMGHSIYGPIGIITGEVFYAFPHALMILVTALSTADARHYEAARSLGAGPWRIFRTVTLPGIRYGLVSAVFVVFTLVITDFGVPKVIGGRFNVLATDVYKQVVGQQNFSMGAVVGIVLLLPALLAFAADRFAQRRQMAMLTARAVHFQPSPNGRLDAIYFAICLVISCLLLGLLGMAGFASFVTFWPYNLSLSLASYDFAAVDPSGWSSYFNSLRLAAGTALAGTAAAFFSAYLVEKGQGQGPLRAAIHFLAMLPLAVPGMVLGIAYIFFFNHPMNPLNGLMGGMTLLIVNTVVHFYTVSHLTALTALKQIDPEFESVSASLKVPFYKTLWRVTLPVSLPAILDIGLYFFLNAMTTVSGVVFLYGSTTRPASVAVLAMDDAGAMGSAAAMAMMIVYSSALVRLAHLGLSRYLKRRTQAWRQI